MRKDLLDKLDSDVAWLRSSLDLGEDAWHQLLDVRDALKSL